MSTQKHLNWRRLVLVSVGIGAAVGLMNGISVECGRYVGVHELMV
jgi:hypothetical protein